MVQLFLRSSLPKLFIRVKFRPSREVPRRVPFLKEIQEPSGKDLFGKVSMETSRHPTHTSRRASHRRSRT